MAKRVNKNSIVGIINKRAGKPEWSELDTAVGHPCGFICYSMWLAKNPKASVKVSRYLASDAGDKSAANHWNRSSFASMLLSMDEAGCALDDVGADLVRWYKKVGKPTPWSLPENRCFLKLEGEWLNTSYEEMDEISTYFCCAGSTVERYYPRDDAEREMVANSPIFSLENESFSDSASVSF